MIVHHVRYVSVVFSPELSCPMQWHHDSQMPLASWFRVYGTGSYLLPAAQGDVRVKSVLGGMRCLHL